MVQLGQGHDSGRGEQSVTVLDTIGGTRLIPLQHMVPKGSSRILLKLEYENPTGSMKDRMALAGRPRRTDGCSRVVRWSNTQEEARACRLPSSAPPSASLSRS